MPYTGPGDKTLPKNVKALSTAKRKKWVATFNSTLAQCEKDEGSDCEGRAFRIANGTIKKEGSMPKSEQEISEAVFGTTAYKARLIERAFMEQFGRQSPDGYYEGPYVRDVFFDDPKFGDAVISSEDYSTFTSTPFTMPNPNMVTFDTDAQREVVMVYEYLGDLVPETEVTVEGESEDAQVEDEAADDVAVVETKPVTEPTAESAIQPELDILIPERLAESHSISILEADSTGAPRDPITITARLIKAGPGNPQDNHYYPGDMLRKSSKIFEGIEMWVTDHNEGDRSEATKVSVIDKIVSHETDGSPIASITVFDPSFAEKVRNRAKSDKLGTLKCSILAMGDAELGEIDGHEYKIVTDMDEALAVDWVSRPGAGGQAMDVVSEAAKVVEDAIAEVETEEAITIPVAIAESEPVVEDENVDAGTDDVEESDTPAQPSTVSTDRVREILSESNLSSISIARLADTDYVDEPAIHTAIASEQHYLSQIAGAGQPNAEGQSPTTVSTTVIPITEDDNEWWEDLKQKDQF